MARRSAVGLVCALVAAGVFVQPAVAARAYTVVVDDETPGRFDAAVSWSASSWSDQRHGSGYHVARPSGRDDYALFRIRVPTTGSYLVSGWWPADRGYNPATPVRISTAGGPQTVRVDQRARGGQWVELGVFELAAGDDWIIAVSARSEAAGYVVADAFRVTQAPGVGAAPVLQRGSRGPAVRDLQQRLVALRYLTPSSVTSMFGETTWHAVVAFQGWQGLERDGIVGPLTRQALPRASPPRPWQAARVALELDLHRQVLLLVSRGLTVRAIHVSTAAPGYHTPIGAFHVHRKERMSWSWQYSVWLPYALYFQEGHAIHGYPSVPAYPASHGCVRVPLADAPGVFAFAVVGTPVWVR